MTTVKKISVTFSKGSFQEWTEASGDKYPAALIAEWETNYNRVITERLQRAFPDADVMVGEGYDQLMETRIGIDFGASPDVNEDDLRTEDYLRMEIEHLIDIGSDSAALEAVWTTPSIEAIGEAIGDATDERPIAKINFEGASFVFAKRDGTIWWMDLDVDDPLNPDDEWRVGTLEDAAIAFREELDPEFELITQAQAAQIVGVSVAAVNNAIRDGRLTAYRRSDTPLHKPGANLVNKSEVLRVWGFDRIQSEGQSILKTLNEINQRYEE